MPQARRGAVLESKSCGKGAPLKRHHKMVREHAYANSGARIALNDEVIIVCVLSDCALANL